MEISILGDETLVRVAHQLPAEGRFAASACLAPSLCSATTPRVQPVPRPEDQTLLPQLAALERSASRNDAPVVLLQLRVIVPDYQQDASTEPLSTPATA